MPQCSLTLKHVICLIECLKCTLQLCVINSCGPKQDHVYLTQLKLTSSRQSLTQTIRGMPDVQYTTPTTKCQRPTHSLRLKKHKPACQSQHTHINKLYTLNRKYRKNFHNKSLFILGEFIINFNRSAQYTYKIQSVFFLQ